MAKPKPTENMERINFTLPKSLKEEWETFAKENNTSVAQMVKDAVREYRKAQKRQDQPAMNPELQVLEMRLEKLLDQKMTQYQETLKQTAPKEEEVNNLQELKGRILTMLEDLGPQEGAKLATYLGISRKMLTKVLGEMQEGDKLVTIEKGLWRVV